jgi:hypothetical protein
MKESFERAKAIGLLVVYGELADKIDAAYTWVVALDWQEISGELAGTAAYHYYPSLEQVRLWFDQARLAIKEEEVGDGYAHFLARSEG